MRDLFSNDVETAAYLARAECEGLEPHPDEGYDGEPVAVAVMLDEGVPITVEDFEARPPWRCKRCGAATPAGTLECEHGCDDDGVPF